MSLLRPQTLLGRTARSLAVSFLLFGIVSVGLLQFAVIKPHAEQSADDLAALLILTAQIWVELPPGTRADYERELLRRHNLRVLRIEAPEPSEPTAFQHISYLEQSLTRQLGKPVSIHGHPDHPGWLWADFPMGGRTMRLGFTQDRLQNRLLLILPFLAALGLFTAFLVSLMLVRRVTRPLAAMAEGAHRIGAGDFSADIPETGPRELAELARKMNEMETRIGQLLENRTTMLAGISHDLRTPLARMRLELEMLETAENREMLDGLRDDIGEMDHLINDTLLLARGLSVSKLELVDIRPLLEQVADGFRKDQCLIEVRGEVDCSQPLNLAALRRVINNLLENAVSYGGSHPIDLLCHHYAEGIEIVVTDRGPGIPKAQREAVLQPFYRLEASRSKATGGSGLGLAIVNQLCLGNGWQLQLDDAPGGGTRASVRLPQTPGSEA